MRPGTYPSLAAKRRQVKAGTPGTLCDKTMNSNGNPTKLRIGSRGSQLALWQANHISALLRARGHEVEIEIIHTTGDKITDVSLAQVGTKGMFWPPDASISQCTH